VGLISASTRRVNPTHPEVPDAGNLPPAGRRAALVPGCTWQGQPILLTEVGGFLQIPDLPVEERDRLYQSYANVASGGELLEKYAELMAGIARIPYVQGFCYTQLTDIEQEMNGLLTYDRRPKVEPAAIAAIHATMGLAPSVTPGSTGP
jgi:hypothetical protein